jgi:hypothetical protein
MHRFDIETDALIIPLVERICQNHLPPVGRNTRLRGKVKQQSLTWTDGCSLHGAYRI